MICRWVMVGAAAFMAALTVAASGRAQTASVTCAAAPGDIYYGDFVTFNLTISPLPLPPGHSIDSYDWEMTNLDTAVASGWAPGPSTQFAVTLSVGNYSIQGRAKIKVMPPMGSPPVPDYFITANALQYEVKPPTTAVLITVPVSPLNTPVPVQFGGGAPNLIVQYEVQGGGRRLFISPAVVERIDRTRYGRTPDMNWGPGPYLSCADGVISDGKGWVFDPALWATVPANAFLDELDQRLGVLLPTSLGTTDRFELNPTFHFTNKRDGFSNNWLLLN